jgi:hypothetical protein
MTSCAVNLEADLKRNGDYYPGRLPYFRDSGWCANVGVG